MADFSPKLEAWTRYSQEALAAYIIAKPDADIALATIAAAGYADKMLELWVEKALYFKQQRLNPGREE